MSPHSPVHRCTPVVHSAGGRFHTLSTALSTGVENAALTGAASLSYLGPQMRPSADSVRRSQGEGERCTAEAGGLFGGVSGR